MKGNPLCLLFHFVDYQMGLPPLCPLTRHQLLALFIYIYLYLFIFIFIYLFEMQWLLFTSCLLNYYDRKSRFPLAY